MFQNLLEAETIEANRENVDDSIIDALCMLLSTNDTKEAMHRKRINCKRRYGPLHWPNS